MVLYFTETTVTRQKSAFFGGVFFILILDAPNLLDNCKSVGEERLDIDSYAWLKKYVDWVHFL